MQKPDLKPGVQNYKIVDRSRPRLRFASGLSKQARLACDTRVAQHRGPRRKRSLHLLGWSGPRLCRFTRYRYQLLQTKDEYLLPRLLSTTTKKSGLYLSTGFPQIIVIFFMPLAELAVVLWDSTNVATTCISFSRTSRVQLSSGSDPDFKVK